MEHGPSLEPGNARLANPVGPCDQRKSPATERGQVQGGMLPLRGPRCLALRFGPRCFQQGHLIIVATAVLTNQQLDHLIEPHAGYADGDGLMPGPGAKFAWLDRGRGLSQIHSKFQRAISLNLLKFTRIAVDRFPIGTCLACTEPVSQPPPDQSRGPGS